MNQIYFLELASESCASAHNDMLCYVSDYKKEKLMKKRVETDKKLGVYADILLRCLLSRQLGKRFEDILLRESSLGKPMLADCTDIEFNLSHTKFAVAVALSDCPVGVDVERLREIDLKLAGTVFTENEQKWLNEPGADRIRRFFEIWTKKEALLKYDGKGLSGGLKTCDVFVGRPPLRLSTFYERDYILSVCTHEALTSERLTILTEANLIKMWQECIC